MKALLLAFALFATSQAQAKDCTPIQCSLTQPSEAKPLATVTLQQDRSDDDKCAIFQGGKEIMLANGKDKVAFSAAEEVPGTVMLQLDFTTIDSQDFLGSANSVVTRGQLAADPVKLEVSYYTKQGEQVGTVDLICRRQSSRVRP
jgi:hypothetical protein